ncbi:hypothetical protein ABC383_27705 [Noviherbaspirillum sp. 1P10PC]|uniref:hypothetical protein n=1 Tax=Noviherbaspirillum sp. 1P10PC TaxID=3132292 RepID=UPI0039A12A50
MGRGGASAVAVAFEVRAATVAVDFAFEVVSAFAVAVAVAFEAAVAVVFKSR